MASQRRIRSAAMSFVRCAGCTVRHLNRRLSLCQSEAVPSQLIPLTGWSSVPGKNAGLPFQVHAHMLRHACGYALANAGHDTRSLQDYLGHKNIQHTVRYTELAPTKFKDFWR